MGTSFMASDNSVPVPVTKRLRRFIDPEASRDTLLGAGQQGGYQRTTFCRGRIAEHEE
jgi:hypothetical protein